MMILLVLLLVAAIVVVVLAGRQQRRESMGKVTAQVFHGKADDTPRPYYVQLYRRYPQEGMHSCGAALIAPGVIVTAAHCLHSSVNDYFYEDEIWCAIGYDNLTPLNRCLIVKASRIMIHERFSSLRSKKMPLKGTARYDDWKSKTTGNTPYYYYYAPLIRLNSGSPLVKYELQNDFYTYGTADIALVYFDIPANYSTYKIAPIQLSALTPQDVYSTFKKGGIEIFGRGRTENGPTTTINTYSASIHLDKSVYDKDAVFGDIITQIYWSRLIPIPQMGNSGPGDSGGPVVYADANGDPQLLAIHRATSAVQNRYSISIHTSISYYANWIQKAIETHDREKLAAAGTPAHEERPSLTTLDSGITRAEIAHVLHVLCAEEMRALRLKTRKPAAGPVSPASAGRKVSPAAKEEPLTFHELWGEDVVDLEKYFETEGAYESLLDRAVDAGVKRDVAEAHVQQAIAWQLVTGKHTEEVLLEMVTDDVEQEDTEDHIDEGASVNKFKSVAYLKSAAELRNESGTRKFALSRIGGGAAWPEGQPRKWADDDTVITCDKAGHGRHELDQPEFAVASIETAGWTCNNILKPGLRRYMFCDFVRKFQSYLKVRRMWPWYPQYLAFARTQPTPRTLGMLEKISPDPADYGPPGARTSSYSPDGSTRDLLPGFPVQGLSHTAQARWYWDSSNKKPSTIPGIPEFRKGHMYWLQKDGTPWPVVGEKTMYEEYSWIFQELGGYESRGGKGLTFSEFLFAYNNDESVQRNTTVPGQTQWIKIRTEAEKVRDPEFKGKITLFASTDCLRQSMIHEDYVKPAYDIGDPVFVRRVDGNDTSERVFSGTVRRYRSVPKNDRDLMMIYDDGDGVATTRRLKIFQIAGVLEKFPNFPITRFEQAIWHWGEYYVEFDELTPPPAGMVRQERAALEEKGCYLMGQDLWPRGLGKVNALRSRALYECSDPPKKPAVGTAAVAVAVRVESAVKDKDEAVSAEKREIVKLKTAAKKVVAAAAAAAKPGPPTRPRWRAVQVAEAEAALATEARAYVAAGAKVRALASASRWCAF